MSTKSPCHKQIRHQRDRHSSPTPGHLPAPPHDPRTKASPILATISDVPALLSPALCAQSTVEGPTASATRTAHPRASFTPASLASLAGTIGGASAIDDTAPEARRSSAEVPEGPTERVWGAWRRLCAARSLPRMVFQACCGAGRDGGCQTREEVRRSVGKSRTSSEGRERVGIKRTSWFR